MAVTILSFAGMAVGNVQMVQSHQEEFSHGGSQKRY
jgi:hypothetical protein